MARHNLGTVISFEVTRTLTKRRFWIATMLVPAVMGVVFGLIFLANSTTTSQVDLQARAELSFAYTDASGYVDPAVVTALGGSKATDPAQAIADVKSGRIDAYFAYPSDPAKQPTQVYGVDKGIFENGKYGAVASRIMVTSTQERIGDKTLVTLMQGSFPVIATTYKAGQESGGVKEVIGPLAFLAVFYLVILLLAQQMVTSLLEEKESRVTEMILTTLDPTTLVVGKVISLSIIGLVQMLVFALPAAVGYVFFRESLSLPNLDLSQLVFAPGPMIVGALLLVGGFVLFTATLVAVGAIMPTARDAGQISAPLMILIFIPFYVVSLVVSDPHALVVQLFTYFPYTAPVTAMLRNGFGSLSPLEAGIVITELFVLGVVALRLAVRLFRYGSIEYSRKVSLRSVFASKQ
jgi:ABC-2 type transport system permease protein